MSDGILVFGAGAQPAVALGAGTQTATSGTVVFADSNGVTWGMSGSTQITASVAVGGGGLTNIKLSAGTSSANLSAITFSDSNGVSFGLNGSVMTATVATNYQSQGAYLTTAALSQDSSKYAGTNGAITGGSITLNTSGASINLPAYLTTADLSQNSSKYVQNWKLTGNTAGTTSSAQGTDLWFSGGNSITVSGSSNTVVFSVGNYITTARASNDGLGTNTAQTNVTWTANSSGLSLNAGGYAGTTTGFTGANLSASMTHNTLGLAISMSAAAPGGGGAPNRSYIQIVEGERFTTVQALSATAVSNRPMVQPFWMDGTGIICNTVRMIVSFSSASNLSLGGTFQVGLYSAKNSTQLTLLGSDSWSISSTVSSAASNWNGVAWVDWTRMSSVTCTAEGRYALGFMVNPVSANATWMPASIYGADNMPSQSRIFSNGTSSATNSTYQLVPFWGLYSTTTASMPGSIAATAVFGGNSASQQDLYAVIKQI